MNPNFCLGLEVHKDSVTIAALRNRDPEPMRVDRLPNDHMKLGRHLERLGAEGRVRACYEASGGRLRVPACPHQVGLLV